MRNPAGRISGKFVSLTASGVAAGAAVGTGVGVGVGVEVGLSAVVSLGVGVAVAVGSRVGVTVDIIRARDSAVVVDVRLRAGGVVSSASPPQLVAGNAPTINIKSQNEPVRM
jgi:hypothetical protein